MNKQIGFLLAGALCVFGASSSVSAGEAAKTGFYINGGPGYNAWTAGTTTPSLQTVQYQGGKGGSLKLGAGYDYKINNLVVGALVDWDFSRIKGTIQDQDPYYAGELNLKSSRSLGIRAGWLLNPSTLAYVNTGRSRASFSGASMINTENDTPTAYSTPAFSKCGWYGGFGLETQIAAHLLVRTEYRYAAYGSSGLPYSGNGSAKLPVATPSASAGGSVGIYVRPTVQTVTFQVAYKF